MIQLDLFQEICFGINNQLKLKAMNKIKSFFSKLFSKQNTYYAVLLFDGQQDYISGTPYSSVSEAKKFCDKIQMTNATMSVTGIVSFKTNEPLIRVENKFDKIRETLGD